MKCSPTSGVTSWRRSRLKPRTTRTRLTREEKESLQEETRATRRAARAGPRSRRRPQAHHERRAIRDRRRLRGNPRTHDRDRHQDFRGAEAAAQTIARGGAARARRDSPQVDAHLRSVAFPASLTPLIPLPCLPKSPISPPTRSRAPSPPPPLLYWWIFGRRGADLARRSPRFSKNSPANSMAS